MIDRDLFLGYRLVIIRAALALSWLGLAGFVWLANRGPGPLPDRSRAEIAVIVAFTLVLSAVPWKRSLLDEIGDAFVAVWAVVVSGAVMAAHDLGTGVPNSAAFVVAVVFAAAALVRPGYLLVVAATAFAAYAFALDRAGLDPLGPDGRVGLAAFAVAVAFALAATIGVGRMFRAASKRLARLEELSAELEERGSQLDELYAISATIGLGGSLTEILPALMGRIVGAIGASVGLAFLFRPDHDDLELISPLWVSGRAVRAEGYTLALTDSGPVQKVFTTGKPMMSNEPVSPAAREPLLADLDTSRIAAVPMAVGGRTIGVIVLADKTEGDFTDDDVSRLQSLAGPAALVLDQMARYDAAQETSQKMAELARLKSDFVSVVSHELRSPITSIIGSLRTVLRPEIGPDSETARDLVASAARQADRLRGLIEDLLMASQLESDALPVRPEATRLDDLIRDMIADLPGAPGRVATEIDEDLPLVEVDPDHLRRVLRNLVENALKYAPDAAIEVSATRSGDEVRLTVADHGPGIAYELHEHIFQPFTQAQHHETRAHGGTGLGLSIVRGLTETMGGRVWYEPTVGGGATFSVSLPLRTGPRRQGRRQA